METKGNIGGIWDELNDRQIQAVNYKLLNPGATYADVGEALGIPKKTIDKWRLNQIIAEIRKDTGKAITDYADRLALKAMRVLEAHMDSEDERVAQSAAKEVIDRSIGKATQRQEVTGKDGGELHIKLTLPKPPQFSDDD